MTFNRTPLRHYAAFTKTEDARILADAAAGIPRQATADALLRTLNSINVHLCWLRRTAGGEPAAPEREVHSGNVPRKERPSKSKRPCLGCRKPFNSEGPHNRLCHNCKEVARHASPYAP